MLTVHVVFDLPLLQDPVLFLYLLQTSDFKSLYPFYHLLLGVSNSHYHKLLQSAGHTNALSSLTVVLLQQQSSNFAKFPADPH